VDCSWGLAFFVPAGTPPAIVATLNAAIVGAMGDARVKDKLGEAGFQVLGSSAAEADKMVKAEARRWADIVQGSGMKRF
jgi:tripartite-type tricarboxylate transporter receptor subunit TctC